MNNVGGSNLSNIDAQKVMEAADALITTVRKRGGNAAQLDLEGLMGEKWRITITRISEGKAEQ
jgi:hypothetical protein